jgi:hypothetical protein
MYVRIVSNEDQGELTNPTHIRNHTHEGLNFLHFTAFASDEFL